MMLGELTTIFVGAGSQKIFDSHSEYLSTRPDRCTECDR